MDALESARSKLRWASKQLAFIDGEIRQFLASHPYHVVRENNAEMGCEVLRLKLAGMPPLPEDISHLVGSFATALRASLDHLTVACAVNPPKIHKVEFPIFDDSAKFAADKKTKIGSLPPDIQTIIQGVQPYHAKEPHRHPLWRSHRLSNSDKHRHIVLVPFGATYSVVGPDPNTRVGLQLSFGAKTLDEDVILPVPPIPEWAQVKLDFKVEPTFAVVLENADVDTGIFMQFAELPTLHDYVRNEVFTPIEKLVP